jgi:hypothetical protein
MNFSEYRTLAERAKRDDRVPEDQFDDSSLESPGWVRKYLDLADRAIQRSKEQEEDRERISALRHQRAA